MWLYVLSGGIIVLASSFIVNSILNFKISRFQRSIDNRETSLLSVLEYNNEKSFSKSANKIIERLYYIENLDKLNDYSLEIDEYISYLNVLIENDEGDSKQAKYIKELISSLEDKTNHYFNYEKINKSKNDIKYELNIDDNVSHLIEVFNGKRKNLEEKINKKFPSPSITNDKFMLSIDRWSITFKETSNNLIELLDMDSKYTDRYKDEITTKLSLLKNIIEKLTEMQVQFVINENNIDNSEIDEIIHEIGELNDLIKDYK